MITFLWMSTKWGPWMVMVVGKPHWAKGAVTQIWNQKPGFGITAWQGPCSFSAHYQSAGVAGILLHAVGWATLQGTQERVGLSQPLTFLLVRDTLDDRF